MVNTIIADKGVIIRTCIFVVIALLVTAQLRAEVVPHTLISEGAVLQQGVDVPIWGTGKDGEQVAVEFQDQKLSTIVKDGRWRVDLKALKPGGPFTLKINTITLNNILVGEVWICTGQSNMNMGLGQIEGGPEAVANSADPMLHFVNLPVRGAATPQRDFETKLTWNESNPKTTAYLSAVAYHFARHLRQHLNVPVGLIFGGNGSMSVQPLTPARVLEAVEKEDPSLRRYRDTWEKSIRDYPQTMEKYQKDLPQLLQKHDEAVEAAKAAGKEPPRPPAPPEDPSKAYKQPSWLYNGRIAPLQRYAIRGVIWYQGESNVATAYEYAPIFAGMIRGWREDWNEANPAQGEFPFLFVQLSACGSTAYGGDSAWAELREAQLKASKSVPNTAMIVSIDFGDPKDIHPKRKEPIGARLALAAQALAYGEKVEYSGPIYDSNKIDGDHVTIAFKHAGSGLMAKDGVLKGFTIAGDDKKFVSAKAEIQGNQIVVSSAEVKQPVAVRYAWADAPIDANLYNKEGLPASPFRTDDFPLSTKTKEVAAK
jgi:sialate O-acetylesterase